MPIFSTSCQRLVGFHFTASAIAMRRHRLHLLLHPGDNTAWNTRARLRLLPRAQRRVFWLSRHRFDCWHRTVQHCAGPHSYEATRDNRRIPRKSTDTGGHCRYYDPPLVDPLRLRSRAQMASGTAAFRRSEPGLLLFPHPRVPHHLHDRFVRPVLRISHD
ncbi:hypothetical protein BDY17DRAFT_112590 [Neohortaea acidophila]|uniref:Uncharacterized protein n=1 Tax=Neohortaea acidophila TaxID=245834 RepID=A0A6A6Q0P3_9PEZI|nr:uncharacterized protein BDY17DRAFT_112590 [Neohortaea acidophila]KAF2485852.1 hypothetical protein BDY17DRAFT_112590 [Neohortaea acidophila]